MQLLRGFAPACEDWPYLENLFLDYSVLFGPLPLFFGDRVLQFCALRLRQPQFALGLPRFGLVAQPGFAGCVQFVKHSQEFFVRFIPYFPALEIKKKINIRKKMGIF
jgi:hypothetical protein